MATLSETDQPQESTTADVTLVTRGITITARIERSSETGLVVCPTSSAFARQVGVKAGDPVELFWRAGYEERTLPAQVAEVEDAVDPIWYLQATGPAERSQRRKAVRARVELPVQVSVGATQLVGETVDLSEAGLRAEVDGWGLPPEPGTRVEVTLTLDKGFVDLRGEIDRHVVNGARWQLSMKFDRVAEQDQDRLRQRVFQALREERARTLD
jgi:hypothetical protein